MEKMFERERMEKSGRKIVFCQQNMMKKKEFMSVSDSWSALHIKAVLPHDVYACDFCIELPWFWSNYVGFWTL